MQTNENTSEREILELEEKAYKIRSYAIQMIYNAKSGHPGGALSIADILSVFTFRKINSRLQGHPYISTPGVDCTTGSLGQGMSNAVGMALGGKLDKKNYRVYAIISDGECEEGSTWESALFASTHSLSNLTVFVDFNGLQLDGKLLLDLSRIKDMWESFGWNAIMIDGHDIRAIIDAVDWAKDKNDKPSVIIAKTVKGKGVSYMEGNDHYHGNPPENDEKYKQALSELEGKISSIREKLGGE